MQEFVFGVVSHMVAGRVSHWLELALVKAVAFLKARGAPKEK